ncbi:hypothetical protein [Streptomyces sp. NRRL S-455]|uniref:hypothetical protein n=1 Tax=Streptomyces sp. NRRL S-455 TaxID=1463908 RepID=UPI0004C1D483|nr:hypothetical protein [Streptomyces sp. NRRL S-455]
MDWKQKEAAERNKRIAAARQWETAQGKPDAGFPKWYEDTGRTDSYAEAYAAWLVSPAKIERWAERSGIFVGRGFARWYIETDRTDSYADAYEIYRERRAAR